MPKIASGLPKDHEKNGLYQIARQLVDDPKTPRLAIIEIDTAKLTIDTDSNTTDPTIRVVHIEPVDAADEPTVRQILERLTEMRTGSARLPFVHGENSYDVTYTALDRETGEIL